MRFLKLLVIVSLVVGVFLVGLSGNRNTVLAQDVSNQTYLVQAGYGTGNIAYFNFAPSSLKVHQGDTVRWIIAGGHNVHFEAIYTPLLLPSQQDGKSVLNVNPAVLFGNVQSGDSYTGGEANNGLSIGGPPQPYFELTINAPVGTYQYYCDIHPGMAGVIEVVDTATAVPSLLDATTQGFAEITQAINGAFAAQAAAQASAPNSDEGATIMIGTRSGQAIIGGFFPSAVVIQMGQSVTWTVPVDALPEPMGIASAPGPKQEDLMVFTPPDGNNPPVIMMTNLAVEGSTPSGASVGQQSNWYSGILDPGESYTLTFREPGVYRYVDTGQGNTGVIVVEDTTSRF